MSYLLTEDSKYLWSVPVSVSTSDSPKEAVSKTLIESNSSVVEIANLSAEKWFKVTKLDHFTLNYAFETFFKYAGYNVLNKCF
jgi:hypothetical protein